MAVVINYDQLQKERTIRPRSPQEKAFANDQLIPFYNKMIDRYSPNAIVLVMVNICSPLKELETVERGLIKGIKGCLMHTNIGIVLQSMMAGSCNLVIPLRSIESIKIRPDDINARDNPDVYDGFNLNFRIDIDFVSKTGDRDYLSVYTADYCDWRDQEYADLLNPKPFLSELRSIQKRMGDRR